MKQRSWNSMERIWEWVGWNGLTFSIMVTDIPNGWAVRSGSMIWPFEWLTNGPPRDWVLLVVGRASSHQLSLSGGRTKAQVNRPPSDWVHVVVGQILMSKSSQRLSSCGGRTASSLRLSLCGGRTSRGWSVTWQLPYSLTSPLVSEMNCFF